MRFRFGTFRREIAEAQGYTPRDTRWKCGRSAWDVFWPPSVSSEGLFSVFRCWSIGWSISSALPFRSEISYPCVLFSFQCHAPSRASNYFLSTFQRHAPRRRGYSARRAERRITSFQRHAPRAARVQRAPGRTSNDSLSAPHIEVVRVERVQGRTSDYFFSAPRAEAARGQRAPGRTHHVLRRIGGRGAGGDASGIQSAPRGATVRAAVRRLRAPEALPRRRAHQRAEGRMVPISTGRYWARGCAFMYSSFRRSMETWV